MNRETMSLTQFSQLTGLKRKDVKDYIENNYPLFRIGKDKYRYGIGYCKINEEKEMTWLEFMNRYDSTITEEQGDYILMEETAFPCSDIRITCYQIRQAIRARLNKISICECCGVSIKFHKPNCYFKEVGI